METSNKFKKWDLVRVKSIDWWNKYKDEEGDVIGVNFNAFYNFTEEMNIFCGAVMLIIDTKVDSEDGSYKVIPFSINGNIVDTDDYDYDYVWEDYMFEDKPVARFGNKYNILSFGDFYIISDFNNKCIPELYNSKEDAERSIQSHEGKI